MSTEVTSLQDPHALVRTAHVRTQRVQSASDHYWKTRRGVGLDPEKWKPWGEVWLEVGAGTGDFFMAMARQNPNRLHIAIERDRMRGKALVRRGNRQALNNLQVFRGNIVPTFIAEVPTHSLDRIFILYPCPWPKNSQRKNRWYNHPVMAHMVRALKPGGKLIWASDQAFYIEEAKFACEHYYGLHTERHGPVAPHPDNGMDTMPEGRTKFERTFLAAGQGCFELICTRP